VVTAGVGFAVIFMISKDIKNGLVGKRLFGPSKSFVLHMNIARKDDNIRIKGWRMEGFKFNMKVA
jgi:hypothetical protein